jgi:hypothetical protein
LRSSVEEALVDVLLLIWVVTVNVLTLSPRVEFAAGTVWLRRHVLADVFGGAKLDLGCVRESKCVDLVFRNMG